ncbi:heavy metal translocating P-type ATPase [Noviherbaspirillum sp. CPCC 100848]|uniref:P-type Zn(2+) transporter n=1 Tax=Noviherbaspirillum album TaxID=3080276 RepID=A0ABU6JEX9_9BURK|nr:heavy metal translocating P-type ATPase [Noviherbaspirillum sp. CPCC 100848]MEC4722214.1 heavy metal translocating P-type ATPase [Noviherbaspirillum sp. CPCC 100848]
MADPTASSSVKPVVEAPLTKTSFRIFNMDCPSEERLIRNGLGNIPGVHELTFDLEQRTLTVSHTLPSPLPLLSALSAVGMNAEEASEVTSSLTNEEATLFIPNMDCPTEERLIRDALKNQPGLDALRFDLQQRTLTLTGTAAVLARARQTLTGIGFAPQEGSDRHIKPGSGEASNCSSDMSPADSCGCTGMTAISLSRPTTMKSGDRQTMFRIENMDCPTEEALIRGSLGKMSGVTGLDFNLMQRTLKVSHTMQSTAPLMKALSGIGMKAQEVTGGNRGTRTSLVISKMDCPTEEALIRKRLTGMPGIEDMQFNLMQRTLTLTHAPEALDAAMRALQEIGLAAEKKSSVVASENEARSPVSRYAWLPMAFSGASALAAEVVHWVNGGTNWLVIALALGAIFSGGLDTYKKGWIAVKNRNLNMNALMSIAVTGGLIIGQWPEAAMVMFLFALAELIEQKSLDRARNAIRGLMDMAPETATVRQVDGSWTQVSANTVAIGAQVRVRPGERIPLDGKVVSGQSTINQAPITGESVPVEKGVGDPVFAGTINEAGSFEFEVTARSDNTTLARIIHAVEEAQGTKAPTQRFVDQFSKVYTPAVFLVALLVAVVPPLAFGQAWYDWVYRALVLLVVACPCALVISTPVTIVSGLAAAARKGVLIKGGVYLEQGRKLNWLALDKTGTITLGKPSVTEYQPLASSPDLVLALASSLASRSDHPVSHAVAAYGDAQSAAHLEVDDFRALLGRGVEGKMNQVSYWLGNQRLANERGQLNEEVASKVEALERQGRTAVMLGNADRVLALFGVADTVRQTSQQAIAELHELGVKTIMLTGDNEHTALAIARQVGIDDARGNQLPEQKLRVVEELGQRGATIGMVGDGINDAPALAKADIGFAMGAAGTDTAIETADVALMDDDLRKVASFVRLSRATSGILTQNIVLALAIKAIFIILTFTGHATMWMAVFADMGASLLVVFNGLRLLRK